jgi:hypothetical protein
LKGPSLKSCLQPLIQCRNYGPAYFALTTKVIRNSWQNLPVLKPFLETVYPFLKTFAETVVTNQKHEVTDSYRDLLAAYVVMRAVSGEEHIPIDVIFSFCCVELRNATEALVAAGDLNGGVAVLDLFPDSVEMALVTEFVQTALYVSPMFPNQLTEEIGALSLCVSRLKDISDGIWTNLLHIELHIHFCSEVLARILNCSEGALISSRALEIAGLVLEKSTVDAETVALFTLLSSKIHEQNSALINFVIQSQNLAKRSSLAFQLLLVLIQNCSQFDYQMVADFTTGRIRKGGLHFIVSLIRMQPSAAIQVAVRGVVSAAAALMTTDVANAGLYLRFLVICGEVLGIAGFDDFIGRATLKAAPGNGAVIGIGGAALKKWKAGNESECKDQWDRLTDAEKLRVMAVLAMQQ